MKKLIQNSVKSMLFLFILLCSIYTIRIEAKAATAVSFGIIDYDQLIMQVKLNGNKMVYYSTDNENWFEVEGAYMSSPQSFLMDISWVSDSSDTTLYFKGDEVKTVKSITLPRKNSTFTVLYNKVEGEFTFENAEEANYILWRKATDYHWIELNLDESSSSYNKFMKEVEKFQLTGTTLNFIIPQELGTGIQDVGSRPSREVSIKITKRANAPNVKVNSSRLTINTSSSMEYYNAATNLWIECNSNMELEELAPKVLYENGGVSTTLQIRRGATNSAPHSKTAYVTIPGQAGPPKIGDRSAEVTYYFMNSKLVLQFNQASNTNQYEYTIVKKGAEFDVTKASWRTVKNSKVITVSSTTAPKGSVVYVRKKGKDANSSKGINVVLASAVNSFEVKY